MPDQQPSVGQIVHYVSHGTPVRHDGSQAFTSQCRAAILTEVGPIPDGDMAQADIEHWDEEARYVVGLCAVNPTGLFFHSIADGGSLYDPNRSGGTWHLPEQA
jgi:hypothetical protein